MALTLVYSVTGLKVRDEVNTDGDTNANAVVQTYWKVVGTDEAGQTADWAGATPFTAANVPAGSFAAFDTLTEDNVLAWITAVVEGDAQYKAHIIGQLEKQIDELVTSEPALPWADEVTPQEDAPEADDLDLP